MFWLRTRRLLWHRTLLMLYFRNQFSPAAHYRRSLNIQQNVINSTAPISTTIIMNIHLTIHRHTVHLNLLQNLLHLTDIPLATRPVLLTVVTSILITLILSLQKTSMTSEMTSLMASQITALPHLHQEFLIIYLRSPIFHSLTTSTKV
ncbi:hypothetical protein V3C99_014820 [Haemonchus contortus]